MPRPGTYASLEFSCYTDLASHFRNMQVAAEGLIALGVKSVLVKLGSDGSLLLPGLGEAPIRQAAFKVENVIDTTGGLGSGSGWSGPGWVRLGVGLGSGLGWGGVGSVQGWVGLGWV